MYSYSDDERELNAVLLSQDRALGSIEKLDMGSVDDRIGVSEGLLQALGYSLPELGKEGQVSHAIAVPSWEEVRSKALDEVGENADLSEIFTRDELAANRLAIAALNDDFNSVHELDSVDIAICASAGIIAGIVDILLVGIPEKTAEGLKAGRLSDAVREYFEKAFPSEDMEKLANSKLSKVPYDAQDNRNTAVVVEGLSAYYHRLLTLGHDPLLGFLFGTLDILAGTMTSIDKRGNVVVQVMECYAERKEGDIFVALAKQLRHLASDVNTSMGLPAPLMGLFNLIQAGSIGEYEQTVAEIVQGMYYEGYDFIHFCSMSIPVMISEVVVRLGYALKRIHEGHSLKESIPLTANREKRPKLGTMLFTAHSTAAAINAGKIYFTGGNPMAINYPQWLAFAKYSYQQLRWVLLTKPEARHKYVMGEIGKEMDELYAAIDESLFGLSDGAVVLE